MRRRARGHRAPTVSLALAAAAAVLALAAAAVEPYLAAAGNAATATEIEQRGPRDAGLRITAAATTTAQAALDVQRRIDEAAPGDAATTLTVQTDSAALHHGDVDQRVRLVARSGASERIEVVRGDADDGLMVPEILAEELALSPGDTVTLTRGDVTVAAQLGGVYRQLDPLTAPDELAQLAELTEPSPGRDRRPLDLALGRPERVLALAEDLGARSELVWEYPATADLTGLDAARAERDGLRRVSAAADDPDSELGGALGRVGGGRPQATVGLDAVVREAERAVAALAGPVRAVGLAGQAVALSVVAAAALFAARHRAVALRLAAVRGQGPLQQGASAALHALPPLLAGAALGWGAALLLVVVAGPPGGLPAGTGTSALRDVAVALVPALVVVGAITAAAVATAVRVGRRRPVLARLARAPWEVVVLALAAIALLQVRAGGGLTLQGGSPQLSPLVLAFPVLTLLGTVGLATRAARRGLPALRRVGRHGGHAGYLALRRMAAAPQQGLALTGACALALGLVVYSAALAGSLAVAVEEKSVLQHGSDAIATGGVDAAAVDGTEVLRARGRLAPTDELVDVLLVTPATFAEVAYWDRGLADGRDLATLLAPLGTAGERLPVLVAGLEGEAAAIDVPGFRAPIEITTSVEDLPGRSTQRPLVVATVTAAREMGPPAEADGAAPPGRWTSEVWARGQDAADRLDAAGATGITSGAQTAAQPRLVAVTWAVGALQALAILATALTLVGVLLFVAGRQRETQLSYALVRRMGLTPSTHRLALFVEILTLLLLALVTATLVGALAAAAVASGLDPLPELQPAPRAAWPARAVGALATTLVVTGVAGAVLLQRKADRDDVPEVLRGG